MKQVLQRIDSGASVVLDIPAPVCQPHEVLIANCSSLVSAGTEKMIIDLSKKSLIGKAKERPDHVRRVLEKLRTEGVRETLEQVRAKLADPMSLGYSSAGVVLEVGRNVRRFKPGDRVASNGSHAEIVAVSQNLVAPVPDGVPFAEACYAVVGSIALQGVRLSNTSVGDRVAVIGLGLIGQLTVMLLRSAGCVVVGTDPDASRCELATELGASAGHRDAFEAMIREATDGHGADSVLITASTPSDEPLELAARVARRKARIVAVGAVGLNVPRREFYPKELELVVSCSYGPGRYDARYEDHGEDYPYDYVRWTEQRNIAAVLELMERGSVPVSRLTTHTFSIEQAGAAYELIERGAEPFLGILLTYPPSTGEPAARVVELTTPKPIGHGELGVGFLGAGNFASLVLLPALRRLPGIRPRAVCTAGGVTAAVRGERHGFEVACTDANVILDDPAINAVFVATRHNVHAEQALSVLKSGKHVFVEKPLAVDARQLEMFSAGIAELGAQCPLWMVGFNRRFSPAARLVREFLSAVEAPLTVSYRFNAGAISAAHWTQDAEIGGGRIVGEACHAIDLASFLVGSRVSRVFAESIQPGGSVGAGDDQTIVVLSFANGSVASICYFAGGDKSFPKERIEILGGGKVAVIDDFRSVTLVADGRSRSPRLAGRDKGHAAELDAFVRAVREGGPPPIPYDELLNVSWASLAAVESLRSRWPIDLA